MNLKKGFTLIELLVVIAIIAILAAILFPVFAQAREKARASSCLSNCKQIGTALTLYTDDYDETVPCVALGLANADMKGNGYGFGGDDQQIGGNSGFYSIQMCSSFRQWTWMDAVIAYIKNGDCLHCPSTDSPYTVSGHVYKCTSYGYNPYLSTPSGQTSCVNGSDKSKLAPKSLSEIKSTAEMVFCADASVRPRGGSGGYYHAQGWIFACPGTLYGNEANFPEINACADRHNGGCNFTFCDGHAKYYKIKQGPLEVTQYVAPAAKFNSIKCGSWTDIWGYTSKYWNPDKQ